MRSTSLITAAALASAGLLAAAPAAAASSQESQATKYCSITVPAKIVVNKPQSSFTARLQSNCSWIAGGARVTHTTWVGKDASGNRQDSIIINPTSTGRGPWSAAVPYSDSQYFLGKTTWYGTFATNDADDTIIQNNPVSYIKVAGWAGLSASRSGSKVTLTASSARYAYTRNAFVPWVNTPGQLQYLGSNGRWVALKSFTSNRYGKYTYSFTYGAARTYRVYYPQTNIIWDAGSAAKRV